MGNWHASAILKVTTLADQVKHGMCYARLVWLTINVPGHTVTRVHNMSFSWRLDRAILIQSSTFKSRPNMSKQWA